MHNDFKARYARHGRRLKVMGFPVQEMDVDELHAVIGFLLEQAGEGTEALLAQQAPLGAPLGDPPKNDGLIEG